MAVAGEELRRASGLAAISAAWDIFRRDAGPDAVGPEHQPAPTAAQLLFAEDPRRDALLRWLAGYSAPAIAEAATTVAGMVDVKRRFSEAEQALLGTARGALAHPSGTLGPIERIIVGVRRANDPVLETLRGVAAAVDRLRRDAGFLKGEGAEVRYAMPSGMLSHYVRSEPAGCWALDLALLAKGAHHAGAPASPGLVSRVLFRHDLEAQGVAARLVDDASAAWRNAYDRLVRLGPEFGRSRDALAHLSRHARTRDAWLLVAANRAITVSMLLLANVSCGWAPKRDPS